jgi:hypothetical protein
VNDPTTVINTLAAAFDRFDWNDTALAGYLVALSDLPLPLLQEAAAVALRTHVGRMPTPAEIRLYAYRAHAPIAPGPDEAWGIASAAMARYGRDNQPEWPHPAIGATIRYLGGWYRLCLSEDQTGDRIAFVRTYRDVVERITQEEIAAPGFKPLGPPEPAAIGSNGRSLPAITRSVDDL